jgi:hypothetical protein
MGAERFHEYYEADPQRFDLLFPDGDLPDEVMMLLVAVNADGVPGPVDMSHLPPNAQLGAAIQFQINCPPNVALDILDGCAQSIRRRLVAGSN